MIDEAVEPLLFDKSVSVSTLVKKIQTVDEMNSPNVVKVVFDYNNYALYSHAVQFLLQQEAVSDKQKLRMADIYKHIGLYVYRKDKLLEFTTLKTNRFGKI